MPRGVRIKWALLLPQVRDMQAKGMRRHQIAAALQVNDSTLSHALVRFSVKLPDDVRRANWAVHLTECNRRPDRRAASRGQMLRQMADPAFVAKAAAGRRGAPLRRFAWCPAEYLPVYHQHRQALRSAAEAKRVTLAQIEADTARQERARLQERAQRNGWSVEFQQLLDKVAAGKVKLIDRAAVARGAANG